MESKPTTIFVNGKWHNIRPVERKLKLGNQSFTMRQVMLLKGGLIIGEGDTGKSTYARMLETAAAKNGPTPIFIRLRGRTCPDHLPKVPDGKTLTVILDGLDECPELAMDIVDLTSGLDEEKYHVWVTSRPGPAASQIARSPILENVYHLDHFTDRDILKIAASVEIDGHAFLNIVRGSRVEAFLDKPGGAVILMQLFADGKLTTSSRTELMESIMRDFARETRDGGDDPKAKREFASQEVLEATCWTAACLVLTGSNAIWTGAETQCPQNDIALPKLPRHGYSDRLFETALSLRLFEPLTSERYRLAYSEMPPFLAGRWLSGGMNQEEILRIIPTDPSFFSRDHARVISWASCYKPELGLPWIELRPEAFLACHELIKSYGCRKYLDLLVKRYQSLECLSPYDFFGKSTLDLMGFDEFAKVLLGALADRTTTSKKLEIAAVLLPGAIRQSEDAAKILVQRLVQDDTPTDIATYRMISALKDICGAARYPCLDKLRKLSKLKGDDIVTTQIRECAKRLTSESATSPTPIAASDETETEETMEIFTERQVAEILESTDIVDLELAGRADPTDDDDYEDLPEEYEQIIANAYPEEEDETEDEREEREAKRRALREEMRYQLQRSEDESPWNDDKPPYTDPETDEDEEYVNRRENGMDDSVICRIIRSQEWRGLPYCSLSRFFDNIFFKEKKDPFSLPKLFACSICHNPAKFIPLMSESHINDYAVMMEFLAWLESSDFLRFLVKGLDEVPAKVVLPLYREVLYGGRIFSGGLKQGLTNRILSEPTVDVERELVKYTKEEIREIRSRQKIDPNHIEENENQINGELGVSILESKLISKLGDDEFRELVDLTKDVAKRRKAAGGKILITLKEMAAIPVGNPEDKPVTLKNFKEIVSASTTTIVETQRKDLKKHGIGKKTKPERTQQQVADDLGFSRKQINKWEITQTEDGPNNKSNKYGYYKSLRTNQDLSPAYNELVTIVRLFQKAAAENKRLGRRSITFERFNEEYRKHNQKPL